MTEKPDQAALAAPGSWAEDWRTIWQSELAALAVDREAQEAVQRVASQWAGLLPRPPDGAARPDAPARPAAVAAAPGDGDAAGLAGLVEQLQQRVAELERRLARA